MNLVLTRRAPPEPVPGVEFFRSLGAALDWARADGQRACFIAGGEALYQAGMAIASRIYLTRVDAEPEGDTFFPEIDSRDWICVERRPHDVDARHAHAFVIETWERREATTRGRYLPSDGPS